MMKAHTVTSVVRTEAGGGLALLHMGHSWCPQCFMNPAQSTQKPVLCLSNMISHLLSSSTLSVIYGVQHLPLNSGKTFGLLEMYTNGGQMTEPMGGR